MQGTRSLCLHRRPMPGVFCFAVSGQPVQLFDRTIPAIIIEPIRMEWHLSDFQLGIIGTAFTLVYAIAGLPLGRMADNGSRKENHGLGRRCGAG